MSKQYKEKNADEEMIEITFSEPRPATEDEKKQFADRIKEARESGEIDEIMIPKIFDDGRVEMVRYVDIEKEIKK